MFFSVPAIPKKIFTVFTFIIFSAFLSLAFAQEKNLALKQLALLPTEKWNQAGKQRNKNDVTAIVLHESGKYSKRRYVRKCLQENWLVHFIVDKQGNIYGTSLPFEKIFRASPALDDVAIHVTVEGKAKDALQNKKQMSSLLALLNKLVQSANIPPNNYDVVAKKGIFTYRQTMKKYGPFSSKTNDDIEKFLQKLLTNMKNFNAQAKYFKEYEWKDRYESDWILRKENFSPNYQNRNEKKIRKLDRGRGFTPAPPAELAIAQKDTQGKLPQEKRLAYSYRGDIRPTCVVLHYTAIDDFQTTLKVLQKRRLSSQVVVDKDGKVYQVMDSLRHKAAAASGTNSRCVQVEIVGKGTKALLKNHKQTKAVVSLVQELAQKYNFPLHNHHLESFSGVFSHTQAKKRWGRSVYLSGDDYDPGEPYMKRVLRKAGGKYYSEEKWYGRKNDNWAILYGDFLP